MPSLGWGWLCWPTSSRPIFLLDAATFLVAAGIILTLPKLYAGSKNAKADIQKTSWKDIKTGTVHLFSDQQLRFALFMQLVASLAGAVILVSTVGYVKGALGLGEAQYGWVMAAMGIGATVAAFGLGVIKETVSRTKLTFIGALGVSLAILPGNSVELPVLMALWFVAGGAQSLVNVSMQTLVAVRSPKEIQGRVYGAHFAWSHLWWAFAYPLAGWLQYSFSDRYFLYGGFLGLLVLIVVSVLFYRKKGNKQALAN